MLIHHTVLNKMSYQTHPIKLPHLIHKLEMNIGFGNELEMETEQIFQEVTDQSDVILVS